MNLLDNDHLQRLVDYSFGDHSGVLGGIPQAFMKKANSNNKEFANFMVGKEGQTVTLFIDNVRLYRRHIAFSDWLHMKPVSDADRQWLNQFNDEDLLDLCARYPQTRFVIFTAFEDTPLDVFIWGRIPDNVEIHAANAVVSGKRITPFPHGIERKMYEGYDHHDILQRMMTTEVKPEKLLFVAHRSDTGARASIGSLFQDKPWATVTHLPYEDYLKEMQKHKFVLCPSGNGIESSRNWETLYMGRVPVFKDHPYLREMFRGFPALFVKEFEDVTEDLLRANEHLFEQKYDRGQLDLLVQFNQRVNG